MTIEEYQKAAEAVSLKNWTRIPPSERTNKELAEFVCVEPMEHIVGPQYTNGVNLVREIYAEIADRLIRLAKENEFLKQEIAAKDAEIESIRSKHEEALSDLKKFNETSEYIDIETVKDIICQLKMSEDL